MMRAAVVVMLGGMDGGPLEALLRRALEASALDTLEAALATGRFERALLLADRAPSLPVPAGMTVEIDADVGVSASAPFQYGRHLASAVARHDIDALLYQALADGHVHVLAGARVAVVGSVMPWLVACWCVTCC